MTTIKHSTGILVVVPNGSPLVHSYGGNTSMDALALQRFACETAECELLALAASLDNALYDFREMYLFDGTYPHGSRTKCIGSLRRAAVALGVARGARIVEVDSQDMRNANALCKEDIYIEHACSALRVEVARRACDREGVPFGRERHSANSDLYSTAGVERLMCEVRRNQTFWPALEGGPSTVAELVKAY